MYNGFFQVVFSNGRNYKFALLEGPWMVVDQYLIVLGNHFS